MSRYTRPTTTTTLPPLPPPTIGQMPQFNECPGGICDVHYEDTNPHIMTLIKTMETVMCSAVLVANAVLLLLLVLAYKRFAAVFFRILNVLVVVIVIRALTTIIFKLPVLWFNAAITNETNITLIVDVFYKYLCILLIFLLSLNRFSIMVYPALEQVLFSGNRYIYLCVFSIGLSAAVTYGATTASNLRRQFEPKIGFIDYIDTATFYVASCVVFLLIATASVCLHLTIIFHLRFYRRTMTTIKSNKVEQKMLREIFMISVINMVQWFLLPNTYTVNLLLERNLISFQLFNILFVLLYIIPIPFNTRLVLVTAYNVLCSIPDVLIPLSVLIGSREVRLEMLDRVRTIISTSKFTETTIIKVSIK